MARTKPRRPARAPAAPAASGPALPARVLRSPIALTALTVGAAAILLYLLPTADLLRGVRDRAAGALGVHVFTLVAAGGAFGALAAAKRTRWLRGRSRVLAAAALLLAFSSGALGLWRPDAAIGGAALAEASAGGALGRWLSGGPPAALAWLLTLPAGLALLWPERARRLLRASPGAAALAGRWLWRRGPRQACAALDARLRRFGEPAGAPGPEELEALRAARAAREAAVAPRALAAADAPPPAADAARDDGEDEAADAGDEEVDEDGRPAVQIPMDMEHEAAGWRHSADGWQLPPLDILRAADAAASDEQDNARRARLIEGDAGLVRRGRRGDRDQRGARHHPVRRRAGLERPHPHRPRTRRRRRPRCSTGRAARARWRSRSRARASASAASPRSSTTSRSPSPRPRCGSRRPCPASR